jgi:rare lipoprotein A
MRSFVFAALAALTASLFGMQPAAASAWQDNLLGVPRDSPAAIQAWERRNGARLSRPSSRETNRTQRRRTAARTTTNNRPARRTRSGSTRGAVNGTTLSGLASFYWQPQRVASGGWFNPNALTAAHKTLPFGTRVRVTNLRNGRSVVVSINDRGPYIRGRIIDLSKRAATVVGMTSAGVVPVRVEVLG